jgi:hypothetical protein
VINSSSSATQGGPFDISLFVASTTGSDPSANNGWVSESLNATTWGQSMGVDHFASYSVNLPSWQSYTGLSFAQAFPTNPVSLNGYYQSYIYNPSSSNYISVTGAPFFPGSSMDGFFFDGSPSSIFFVAGGENGGPAGTFLPGSVLTYSGISTDVPEPVGLCIAVSAVSALALRSRRTLTPHAAR